VQQILSIRYSNYKSFKEFTIELNKFNILVGQNNAGKSTIIGSLKILAEGIRKAKSKKPISILTPGNFNVYGYEIDLNQVPVGTENVFHNYNDDEPARIEFLLSDNSIFHIFFPRLGVCNMYYESDLFTIKTAADFKKQISLEIGFVPVLGPVDHKERLFQEAAARSALLSYNASRNFRNIWYHYGEDFEIFKDLIQRTWPGMDIEPPEVNTSSEGAYLDVFCPENRIPREIFWAGFGFQVWCQMLTYIVKNKNASLFLIDEPDIYLHSDLQRQLLGILKNLGPDIIIATHSTEIISEAEINDIILVNKNNINAVRIKDPIELKLIYSELGSNLNPILTQIAKTRKVLFLEGNDYTLISKFARFLKFDQVANRTGFSVVSIDNLSEDKINIYIDSFKKTINSDLICSVIYSIAHRSESEINNIKLNSKDNFYFVEFITIPEKQLNRTIEFKLEVVPEEIVRIVNKIENFRLLEYN
jgi:energy-coupling factor transporter ATP-binding protein EcfA2